MKLRYCTFTGPDELVNPERLNDISRKYPFVEWAIPHNRGYEGTARYPSAAWVNSFHEICKQVNKATHLCNLSLIDFMERESNILEHVAKFPRVQLNFGFGFDLRLVQKDNLRKQVEAHPDKKFILQYNDRTSPILSTLTGLGNVALLYDASAGTGISPDGNKWPVPVSDRAYGYAGGIGPENIGKVLEALHAVIPAKDTTWIDMETRVRTDNQFDLGKVCAVLEHIDQASRPTTRLPRPLIELVP